MTPTRARFGAALAGLALALGTVTPAHASPGLDVAKRKAAALRKAVAALEVRAAKAVEDYDAANDELARAVSARLAAEEEADRAQQQLDAGADAKAQRIRALYMTGGTMTLYASVMDAPDLGDAVGRIANVTAVLRHDGVIVDRADAAATRADAAAARLRDVSLKQARLERRVAGASVKVQQLLDQQRSLLDAADADVRRIAEEDARRAAEAAHKAFLARLAAARANAGNALPDLRGDDTTPPNAIAANAIAAAKAEIGKPYQWGATGPDTFDCSGLTGWAYGHAGLPLPRTSRQQWFAGPHPDLGNLAPGDLLFWATDPNNPGSIHHVAMYLGAGMMIAAPHTGANVQIQPVYLDDFFGVTRPTAAA